MEFAGNLYVGESIRNAARVKWKLKHGAGQFHVYVISLAANRDQLDIFHCKFIKQKYFDRKNLYVVGLAGNYGEAVGLVQKMLEETLAQTGGADIKAYICSKEGIGV